MRCKAGMEEQREAGRTATAASAAHQLDIASRGVLATTLAAITGCDPKRRAELAATLNRQRRCKAALRCPSRQN